MGEKYPYAGGKNGTNFPSSSNSMDLTTFPHAVGKWWGNLCISHVINYIIGCESNGKKALIIWENYEYQFPRFSLYDGFCRIFSGNGWWVFLPFPILWEIDERSNAFLKWWSIPQDENLMEKTIHFMEKVWEPVSLNSLMLWEFDDKNRAFSMRWSIPEDGNIMKKGSHTMRKVWVPSSEVLHIQWVL